MDNKKIMEINYSFFNKVQDLYNELANIHNDFPNRYMVSGYSGMESYDKEAIDTLQKRIKRLLIKQKENMKKLLDDMKKGN